MISNTDLIIWTILIFVFFIIVGLYISEDYPLSVQSKKDILNEQLLEGFSDQSTDTDISKGASPRYNWGMPEATYTTSTTVDTSQENSSSSQCDITSNKTTNINTYNVTQTGPSNQTICKTCDITLNKDIDKYILKSSVPPCPDMSMYATKNMMDSCPDMRDYILKSEVPHCEKVNMHEYIRKSEIPACPSCPECPICPICPICPDKKDECKTLNQYNITDHPDMNQYMLKSEVEQNYILKSDVPKSNNEKCISQKQYDQLKKQLDEEKAKKNQDNIKEEEIYNYRMTNNNNSFNDLKSSNIGGFYAGDSLYAAV